MRSLHHPGNRRWALAFEVVNACSWSAMLGVPLILLLKSQHAQGWVLGTALALLPLTQALQPLGARWLPRYGYRGLMVRGWTARTLMVGLMALLALRMDDLPPAAVIGTTLVLLTIFTVIRGLTSCAWMPWITQIVPEQGRGRYLAWSTALIQATVAACLMLFAWVLEALPGPAGFACIYAWGCLTGFAAAWTMLRIDDAPAAAEGAIGRVPWGAILAHAAFRRLLVFLTLACVALAALGVLWVPVLRDIHHQGDAFIARLPVFASLAQLVVLPVLGPLVDRTGSRPMLAVSLAVWVVHAGLWAGLAAGWLPLDYGTLAAIQATAGLGSASFVVASQHLLMGTVPGQGRTHFFALHSVAMAIGQGVAPVLWGLALDISHDWPALAMGLGAHAALYLLSAVLLAVAMLMSLRLSEPRALSTAAFLGELLRTPARALARLASPSEGR